MNTMNTMNTTRYPAMLRVRLNCYELPYHGRTIPVRIKPSPRAIAERHFDLDFRGILA